jgi:alpha-ketoglutarate-dependent taurine dioxygenase
MHNYTRDEVGADENINVISTDKSRKLAEDLSQNYHARPSSGLLGWHTDIAYEPIPSDYTSLRLTQLPRTGGGNNHFPHPFIHCPTLTLSLLQIQSGPRPAKSTTACRHHTVAFSNV